MSSCLYRHRACAAAFLCLHQWLYLGGHLSLHLISPWLLPLLRCWSGTIKRIGGYSERRAMRGEKKRHFYIRDGNCSMPLHPAHKCCRDSWCGTSAQASLSPFALQGNSLGGRDLQKLSTHLIPKFRSWFASSSNQRPDLHWFPQCWMEAWRSQHFWDCPTLKLQ